MQVRALAAACVGFVALTAACAPTPPPTSAPKATPKAASPTTIKPKSSPTTKPQTTTTVPAGSGCAPYQQTTPTGGADPFNITVVTLGEADCFASEITAAVSRWEQIIIDGLPQTTFTAPANSCTAAAGWQNATMTVDDLKLAIRVEAIDGKGGVLGSAGYCYADGSPVRPRIGVMTLDVADVEVLRTNGKLVDTITHEIGHILGIGTLWQYRGLLTGSGTNDPRYTGPQAVGEWHNLGGEDAVPLETGGGEGTAEAHWHEDTFLNELMTGWIGAGSNPISRVTIASLEDLGYTVDYTKADPYALPGAFLKFGAGLAAPEPLHTEPFDSAPVHVPDGSA